MALTTTSSGMFPKTEKTSGLGEQLASTIVKGRSKGKGKRYGRQLGSYLSGATKKRTVRGMSTINIESAKARR